MRYSLAGKSLLEEENRIFLKSLVPALRNVGHDLVSSEEDAVISFGSCEGINHKKILLKWDNTCTPADLDKSNCVIFLDNTNIDEFCTDVAQKKTFIIGHGIDTKNVVRELPPGLSLIRQEYQFVFSASSTKWCKEDNFSELVNAHEELKKTFKNGCIIIIGDEAPRLSGTGVFYASNVSQAERLSIFSMSNFLLSFTTRHPEPSEVLEALSQGTFVLHNNQPQITTLCGRYGRHHADALKSTPEYPWNLDHIDIHSIARKYSDALQASL